MNKVGLQDIVGGQLQEKFNRAFEKVVENLQDPNTSFKVKRGIDIKLGFTQNGSKSGEIKTVSYFPGSGTASI